MEKDITSAVKNANHLKKMIDAIPMMSAKELSAVKMRIMVEQMKREELAKKMANVRIKPAPKRMAIR